MSVVPAITGFGLVTPLGRTASETWQALLAGQFISTHSSLNPLGESKQSIPRVASLAIETVNEATLQADWQDDLDDVAVIACTSKGSVESWIAPPLSHLKDGFGLCDLSAIVSRHLGSTIGPRLTLSAACAGGLHGLIRAAMMIQNKEATRVLVVGVEASVHPLFLGSFGRLGVFPPDGELCRPFDLNRSGFLMSEAAAALCIEADTSDRSIVKIGPFAFGGDATHLTGNDPDGKVLRHLLKKVVANESIDLVHAHGTGTLTNDSAELNALESLKIRASLFSHKGALGHSLGASGLVSTVLNCMCHQTSTIPANINTTDPLPMDNIQISRSIEKKLIRRSIIHAAGFGGPTAVVQLSS